MKKKVKAIKEGSGFTLTFMCMQKVRRAKIRIQHSTFLTFQCTNPRPNKISIRCEIWLW